jgi:DNA-binding CsgD family transcriptional regulator/tetratricopeptide (TPR) repeat protein
LTSQNGPWVADICRRLDGIPLAIELAAARSRAFSVRQIAERLDDRFHLLSTRLRTVPLRHQTLQATLDWSYQLLTGAEQTVLRRLSVFVNGWRLEAAEAVCSDDTLRSNEVMEVLSNLVDKSFVAVDSHKGRRRYHFLETIRQYAMNKLRETGEESELRNQHLEHFTHWAEINHLNLTGPDQADWLDFFEADHDNIRTALDWSLTSGDRVGWGLSLAGTSGNFWRLRGYLSEGRERLAKILISPQNQEKNAARARALLWSANLAYLQSDYPATRSLAEEGLEIYRELDQAGKPGVARALGLLGEVAKEMGDYEIAPVMFEKALSIYRELNEKSGIADMLMQLGWAAMRVGDYEQASTFLNEGQIHFRELGERTMLGFTLAGLGELAVRTRSLDKAQSLLEESLALRQEMGSRWGTAASLGSLGWVALLQRDYRKMRELLGESLAIRVDIGDRGGIAWCLEKLAEAIVLQTQAFPSSHRRRVLPRAVRLFGAAAALRAPFNSVIDPADQPNYQRIIDDLRGALGDEEYTAAWDEGGGTPLSDIIDMALAPVEAALLSHDQASKVKFGGLSAREREAAVLIAQGKTNREIAEIMVVRVKTVETYITRILDKLGFDSRVQIATWAHKVGLVETT